MIVRKAFRGWLALMALLAAATAGCGATATGDELVVVDHGVMKAVVVVSPDAGKAERLAAADLAKYIERMSGARPALADSEAAIGAALGSDSPLLIVGSRALKLKPSLTRRLARAAKNNPTLRADAIALRRDGNRVYLAGNGDDAHYYAAAWLLRLWGCRWFMPTDFGECIPARPTLTIGPLDHAHGSPFEVRKYWISWNGDGTGAAEFRRRNMMNEVHVPNGHHLAAYTKDLVPPGKTVFNVPIAEPATARHVARQVAAQFGRGKDIMLGMEDGIYQSDSPIDKELGGLQFDKYFMLPSMTDAFMVFYNNVADALMKAHPRSGAHIGFLVYSNITLPPVRPIVAKRPLVAYLAPIDIDPIHGMDDANSPPRQEYRDMLYAWSKVMRGRVVIYDYDQSMLVWRDIPNPSHQAFRHDVKHYRKAGILGVDVESRNAIGTVFLNLYLRAQLMWNPDADVDELIEEFYPKFYGLAAAPMKAYWSAIFEAWDRTLVTEHEHFVAPAIYTPRLINTMRKHLLAAEAIVKPLAAKARPTRREKLLLDRMRFTRLSFDIADNYLAMVRAAATDADYAAAVAFGKKGLAAREAMTRLSGIFTTYLRMPENGPAWWPGEVQQYADLLAVTDGAKGRLVARLPVEWALHRDPKRIGDQAGYATKPVDLTYWSRHARDYTLDSLKDYPVDQWEMIRTDLYAQAQGVRGPDRQSYLGYLWYRTRVSLTANQVAKPIRLRFPGVLNEGRLYVNGRQVAHRPQGRLWWLNDYKFEWDIDLTGKLQAGTNTLTLKLDDIHHWGGIFRRPFLYAPAAK